MSVSLHRELTLLGIWLLCMWLLGLAFDAVFESLFVGVSVYLIWHLYNLNRLTVWLTKPSKQMPETRGIWDDIYYLLYNLYKRQRKARKKLAAILTRFQESTEALPYATVILNAANEIEWFNPAAKHMFNLHASQDIGQRIDNLIRLPVFIKYLNNKRYQDALEFELNQRNIQLNIIPYGSGQYLVTARDVTLNRQLNDMRRDFVSNASHELRTPVTVMSGYIEMLLESDDEAIRQPLQKIQQQSDRMKKIIDELIELAKLESATEVDETETVDVGVLLEDVYSEAIGFDQDRHTITLSGLDDNTPLVIRGRYDELRMATSNLMTNAIRYTPTGGEIDLSVGTDDKTLAIIVRDTGIGIDYEHIPRLTERFYRVDEGRSREQGGTGLGLAIVKHVLDRHHASLHIYSVPGQGSEFRCEYPRSLAGQ